MTERIALSVFENLPYEPLQGQLRLVSALAAFAAVRPKREVFVVNGYAGTGKTSIMGAFVKALKKEKIKTVVLAPTGRAAKVAALFADGKASTIHKRVFRADSLEPDARFFPAPNQDRDTIFIVDEASLITDKPGLGDSLLTVLTKHVYSSPGCVMILVGDTAQLPPVGQSDSPAMNPARLRALGFIPHVATLSVPVRQACESGILYNATLIRNLIEKNAQSVVPTLAVSQFPDVEIITTAELADYLSTSWSLVGAEETLIITRSNKRANKFNMAIRNMVMMADAPLQSGDRLVISKNDYYWSKNNKLPQFLANGDIAVLDWVGQPEKKYGRWFCDVEMTIPTEDVQLGAKIMLKSLMCEGASLPQNDMDGFYQRVLAGYGDNYGENFSGVVEENTSVRNEKPVTLSQRIKAAVSDPYYNALQVKYAYCVTCHKAQGGQWRHVYIDMGAIDISSLGSDFYRWLYTAITRSTEKIFLINPTIPLT